MRVRPALLALSLLIAACANDTPPDPLYIGMTSGHFLRAGCIDAPTLLTKVDDVSAYDCLRAKGRYTVELRAGAIVTIHSPEGKDLRRAN